MKTKKPEGLCLLTTNGGKMKTLTIAFVAVFAFGATAFGEENKSTPTQSADKAVQTITGTEKTKRKKKVEMCGECGKPEAECECKGHKDEKKKDDK